MTIIEVAGYLLIAMGFSLVLILIFVAALMWQELMEKAGKQ